MQLGQPYPILLSAGLPKGREFQEGVVLLSQPELPIVKGSLQAPMPQIFFGNGCSWRGLWVLLG